MSTQNPNNWKKQFDSIRMTNTEKIGIKHSLVQHIRRPIASPWYFMLRPVGVAVMVLAVITVGTVGISSASNDSLPTDALYPVKIFKEQVVLSTKKTSQDRAQYQIVRVGNRLDEATALAKQKKLTPELSHKITEQVTAHVSDTTAAIKETASVDPKQALETATTLETTLEVKTAELVSTINTEQKDVAVIVPSDETSTSDQKELTPAEDLIRSDTRAELAEVLLTVTTSTTENKRDIKNTKDTAVETIKKTDKDDQRKQAEDALKSIGQTTEAGLTPEPTNEVKAPEIKTTSDTQTTPETKVDVAPTKIDETLRTTTPTEVKVDGATDATKPTAVETSTLITKEITTETTTTVTIKSTDTQIKDLITEAKSLFQKGDYAESIAKSQKAKSLIDSQKAATATTVQ